MLIRTRVSLVQVLTRESDMVPDPTADRSSVLLITLEKATTKNAAPRSLGALLSELMLPSMHSVLLVADGGDGIHADCP